MAKKEFQAESKKLMDMMINSIYTNKEIFLRELISNASDAIDKLYYKSLTDTSVGMNKGDFRILLTRDKDSRTLTISDNGVGMTRDEVIDYLGTIAKSGTKSFLESLGSDQAKDSQLIGQFGVGFYSAFIVADKVTRAYSRGKAKNQKTASSGNRLAKVNIPLPTSPKKIVVLKSPCICVKAKTSSSMTGACVPSSANTPTISRCR